MPQNIKAEHISDFLENVKKRYQTGIAQEPSYRDLFVRLFEESGPDISIINDGKRIECGAPDLCILRNDIPIGYVECKHITEKVYKQSVRSSEQVERYKNGLSNFLLTDCLNWYFYINGKETQKIKIGRFNGKVEVDVEKFDILARYLTEFVRHKPKKITKPKDLAQRLAGKAQLIRDVFKESLELDKSEENKFRRLHSFFCKNLIPEISVEDFSGIFAETIIYGMFVAWLENKNPRSFSRGNALVSIPTSNQFLSSVFSSVAGQKMDDRLVWIIDDLVEIFKACNRKKVTSQFGKLTSFGDPFFYFYETFFRKYDPKASKQRGVWYTPEPIVKFIVGAVDQIIQKEFKLESGLASESKVNKNLIEERAECDRDETDIELGQLVPSEKKFRVQILDPCVGTGTFLAEVVRNIASKVKSKAPAQWSNYVEENLIPRLHGFELFMAPYAMCNIRLDKTLSDLEYNPKNPQRYSIYLTNSLLQTVKVEGKSDYGNDWILEEVYGANSVKQSSIMCVIGNPPYNGRAGKAKGKINELLNDYRKEPGSQKKLEGGAAFTNDLYVRFIRLASHFIEENEKGGVFAFITNHSYLDSFSSRGMRWHLLKTFDKIWILDLHGNVMKKETTNNDKSNENVFNIQQGVAIIIAVKNNMNKKELADIYRGDLIGEKNTKFHWLKNHNLDDIKFKKIESKDPYYPFIGWDYRKFNKYKEGIPLNELMPENRMGIKTNRDRLTIDKDRKKLWNRIQRFVEINPEEARKEFNLPKDGNNWKVKSAQKDVENNLNYENTVEITYRPFDDRWTYYTGTNVGIHCSPSDSVMRNFLQGKTNFGLVFTRQVGNEIGPPVSVFVTNKVFDCRGVYTNRGGSQIAPLYIYSSNDENTENRIENFDPKLRDKLCKNIKNSSRGMPDGLTIFDYIYGTFYDKSYRRNNDKFLRIDYPKIPCPKNSSEFWAISDKGRELRILHLSVSEYCESSKYELVGDGDNIIGKYEYEEDTNRIRINQNQYFKNVPKSVWDMYIGGYQPAQRWLSDHKGMELEFERGYRHYQRILEILEKTIDIMNND